MSEAWALLGEKGDAYAFLAAAILSSDTTSMPIPARVFYEMVRIQWENTVGPGLWGTQKFIEVGQKHLSNYLKLLEDGLVNGTTTLPTTEQIEASYKNALQDNLLPPITAIDSLFSVIDTYFGTTVDFSWAQFMDWFGNWTIGGPRWEADRIKFNSDVFLDSVTPFDAALTFGRTVVNAAEAVPGGDTVLLEFLAPAYWALKFVDETQDFLDSTFKCNTPDGLGCCDGKTLHAFEW